MTPVISIFFLLLQNGTYYTYLINRYIYVKLYKINKTNFIYFFISVYIIFYISEKYKKKRITKHNLIVICINVHLNKTYKYNMYGKKIVFCRKL